MWFDEALVVHEIRASDEGGKVCQRREVRSYTWLDFSSHSHSRKALPSLPAELGGDVAP